jgi:hypothetical protein
MSNIYYEPNKPRRVFQRPITSSQYIKGAGRCNHCESWLNRCDECRQELSPFKTVEAIETYEATVQLKLREAESVPVSRYAAKVG